jgi:basic membrane protein A
MSKSGLRAAGALIVTLALLATGCGDKKESSKSSGDSSAAYKACEVTDTGGVDDKSFNQTAYKGVLDAKDLGVEAKVFESKDKSDFAPNISQALSQKCDLVVTVGFLLGDATLAAAQKNTKQRFAIVDYAFFDKDNKKIDVPNVRELTFSTDQAAFLAGYVAAGTSKTGKVATYGGIQIPTVTIFMDGFKKGVDQYNKDSGKSVKLLGWNGKTGQFVGNFEDSDKGGTITASFLQDGADVIMPVAGPVGQGTISTVKAAGGKAKIVWVDTDGCVSVPDACKYFLTSVVKNMDVAVLDTVKAAKDDTFKGGIYTGTLKNDGVGIAPYHEFDATVPKALRDKVDEYKQQIISGELKVSS